MLSAGAACAPSVASRPASTPHVAGPHAEGPSGAPKPGGLAFGPFDGAAFQRAARENKLVLLDGAAEWCHWCHVMAAVTYHDPRVKSALEKSFVVTRVDIDERPDI